MNKYNIYKRIQIVVSYSCNIAINSDNLYKEHIISIYISDNRIDKSKITEKTVNFKIDFENPNSLLKLTQTISKIKTLYSLTRTSV